MSILKFIAWLFQRPQPPVLPREDSWLYLGDSERYRAQRDAADRARAEVREQIRRPAPTSHATTATAVHPYDPMSDYMNPLNPVSPLHSVVFDSTPAPSCDSHSASSFDSSSYSSSCDSSSSSFDGGGGSSGGGGSDGSW